MSRRNECQKEYEFQLCLCGRSVPTEEQDEKYKSSYQGLIGKYIFNNYHSPHNGCGSNGAGNQKTIARLDDRGPSLTYQFLDKTGQATETMFFFSIATVMECWVVE